MNSSPFLECSTAVFSFFISSTWNSLHWGVTVETWWSNKLCFFVSTCQNILFLFVKVVHGSWSLLPSPVCMTEDDKALNHNPFLSGLNHSIDSLQDKCYAFIPLETYGPSDHCHWVGRLSLWCHSVLACNESVFKCWTSIAFFKWNKKSFNPCIWYTDTHSTW